MYALDIAPSDSAINQLVDNQRTFHDRIFAIEKLRTGYVQAMEVSMPPEVARQEEFMAWALRKSRESLEALSSVVKEDGYCLAGLALSSIVPIPECITIAKGYTSNSAFMVGLTTRINDKFNVSEENAAEAMTLLTEIGRILVSELVVECRKSSKRPSAGSSAKNNELECLVDGRDVALLLSQLCINGPVDESQFIVEKLSQAASTCELIAFEAFYFPLLSELSEHITIDEFERTVMLEEYKALFYDVLSFYIRRYVQPKPQSSTLARRPEGCGSSRCHDCRDLDNFLRDPHQATKAFPVSKPRRHHLHVQLNDTFHKHTTDRSHGGDTLMAKKGLGANNIKLRDWEKRAKTAQEKILGLDRRVLKALLGPQYKDIAALRVVWKAETVVDLT